MGGRTTHQQAVAKAWADIQAKKTTYEQIARTAEPRVSLLVYMHKEMLNQITLAARLGVAQPTVAQWLNDRNAPSETVRKRIEEICLIPVGLWGRASVRL